MTRRFNVVVPGASRVPDTAAAGGPDYSHRGPAVRRGRVVRADRVVARRERTLPANRGGSRRGMHHGLGLGAEADLRPGEKHPVLNPGDLDHAMPLGSPGALRRAGLAHEGDSTGDDHCNRSDPVNPGAAHGKPLSAHSAEDSPRCSPCTCPLDAIRCTRFPKNKKTFAGHAGRAHRGAAPTARQSSEKKLNLCNANAPDDKY